MAGDSEFLPRELTSEILARLPVKSLLRLKSVSESWCCLISSPQFVKSHLKISTEKPESTRTKILFKNYTNGKGWTFYTLSPYPITTPSLPSEIECPFGNALDRYQIWDSCNGLFCMSIGSDYVFLWNPSTKESRKLPSSGISMSSGTGFTYGFGHVENPCDYKVIEVIDSGHENGYDISVYSLRTDSWRKIQHCPIPFELNSSGKFFNEKVHWIAETSDENKFLTTFNLLDESFQKLGLPDLEDGVECHVGSSGGNLCLICYGDKIDLWTLKSYDIVESWEKVISIPIEEFTPFPVIINKNHVFVHEAESESLMWYNNGFLHPEVEIRCDYADNHSVFIESLVSPTFLEEPPIFQEEPTEDGMD